MLFFENLTLSSIAKSIIDQFLFNQSFDLFFNHSLNKFYFI